MKGMGLRGAGFSSAPRSSGSLAALQIVATRGEINREVSTSGVRQISRTRHFIGGRDASSIAFLDANWYVNATDELNGEAAFDVERFVEYNGVAGRITWAASNTKTVAAGDTVVSDEVSASAFGLPVFYANDEIWVRSERTRAATSLVAYGEQGTISGETMMHRADTAASQVNGLGPLSTTGGWTNSFSNDMYYPLAIIGRPTAKMAAILVVGASKEHGQDDDAGDGNNDGGGYVRRACASVGGLRFPHASVVISGESSATFVGAGSTKRRAALLPYAPIVMSGHGGNDYTLGRTIAQAIADTTTEATELQAQGGELHWVLEMPKTDSLDSWATVLLQTPRTGYATGGAWRDAFNSHINGLSIAGKINLNATVADSVALDKWQAPGETPDGTHPSKASHIELASALATYLASARSAYEGGTYTLPDYEAEADTLFAAMTEQPSRWRKLRYNDYILALKTAGVWSILDCIYLWAAMNSQHALLNIKNPGTNNATLTSSPTFTAFRGYTTNGTSSYIAGPNPVTMAGNFAQNSACFGARFRNAQASGTSRAGWFDGTDGTTIQPHEADGAGFAFRVNQAANSSNATFATVPDVLIVANRSASNATQLYTQGVSRTVSTNANQTSTALNSSVFRFGSALTGSFAADQYASGYIGGSLDATQQAALYAADLAYMQAVGAA